MRRVQWEYYDSVIDLEKLTEYLDALGADGWELVSVLPWYETASVRCILKRPAEEE